MTHQNQPDLTYANIDKTRKGPTAHEYQHLQRGKTMSDRVPERLQMAGPEPKRSQKKSCRCPPWWGWLIIVLGIVLICVMATLLVFYLISK